MFRKLLIASSIGALAGSVNAATLYAPQEGAEDDIIKHTMQGIVENDIDGVVTTNYLVTLGAEYTSGDIISLTYSSPLDGGYTPPATLTCDEHVRVHGGTASDGELTFGLLSATTTVLNYRVNTVVAGINKDVVSCVLPQVTLDATAAASIASATVTFGAQTASGVDLDTDPAAVTIATVVDQYAAGTVDAPFSSTVDVTQGRVLFEDNTSADQMTFTIAETAAGDGEYFDAAAAETAGSALDATTNSVVNTVTASSGFAFTDTTDADGILFDNITLNAEGVTDEALSIDGTVLTYSGTMGTAQDLDLALGAEGGMLPVQTYTISTTVTYDTDKTETFAAISAGEFDLNATEVTVYSVPFSDGVIRMLWASNGSSVDGTAEATIVHEGVTMGPYDLGTVAADSNESLNAALITAVADAGDTMPTDGRGDITFTITSSDTKVLGSYYKDGDRLLLESSDTLNSDIPE